MTCACGVDVHAHVIPHDFPTYLRGAAPAGWPSMAPAHECHRHVMIDGKNYRTVSDKCWSVSKRLSDFEPMGLQVQAISPMPELLSYWLAPQDGFELVRYLNEQIALMVSESGGALVGLGAVPLQDMDLALKELEYVKHKLEFSGVEIGSNILGKPVGHPDLAPFFEACEAMDMAVFVHALRPVGMDRLVGPPALQQVLAYPSDLGLSAASAITSNLMVRYPKLRIAFSHGGGTLLSLLPRLQQAWGVFPALESSVQKSPAEQARSLYFDTLVFDTPTLQHLVQVFGSTQLILGTDYPFNFHDHTPVQRLLDAGLDADTVQRLSHINARTFLGMPL